MDADPQPSLEAAEGTRTVPGKVDPMQMTKEANEATQELDDESGGGFAAVREDAEYTATESSQRLVDKRVGPRTAAYIPIKLDIAGLSTPLTSHSRDIGTNGLSVATATPFDIASVKAVLIDFPTGSISIASRGCWQRSVEDEDAVLTGIQFVETDLRIRRAIAEVVQQRGYELAYFLDERGALPDLNLDDSIDVAFYTRLRQVPAYRFVYHAGQAGSESLFIVFRGAVRIVRYYSDGRDRVFREGESFGGLSLLCSLPSCSTCVTEMTTQLLELDPDAHDFLEIARPLLTRRLRQSILKTMLDRLPGSAA